MAMVYIRKVIRDFVTANPGTDESSIVTEGVSAGARAGRVTRILGRMVAKGRITNSGDSYTVVPK